MSPAERRKKRKRPKPATRHATPEKPQSNIRPRQASRLVSRAGAVAAAEFKLLLGLAHAASAPPAEPTSRLPKDSLFGEIAQADPFGPATEFRERQLLQASPQEGLRSLRLLLTVEQFVLVELIIHSCNIPGARRRSALSAATGIPWLLRVPSTETRLHYYIGPGNAARKEAWSSGFARYSKWQLQTGSVSASKVARVRKWCSEVSETGRTNKFFVPSLRPLSSPA